MYISRNRITGCIFAEVIKTAHRIISAPKTSAACEKLTGLAKSNHRTLQFGTLNFLREPARKNSSVSAAEGAIFCEEESVAAKCGIRAIWVAPSKRRQRIASKLLDSVR